jgi:hypothetical protein
MKCINLARVEILVTFSPGGCSNILKDKNSFLVGQSLVFLFQYKSFNPKPERLEQGKDFETCKFFYKKSDLKKEKCGKICSPGLEFTSFCLKHFACKSDILSDIFFAQQKNLTFEGLLARTTPNKKRA